MPKCHYCEREAVVRLPYAKLNLCEKHFEEYLLRKLERSIARYGMFKKGERVVVGVSGGKDSIVLADLLSKLGSAKLLIVHVDLGIGEYSRKSSEVVRKFSVERGLDYFIVRLLDYNTSIPELASSLRSRRPCSICGVVKRYVLNAVALDLGFDAVATAHHGDDISVYILKSFLTQDYDQLYKNSPVNPGIKGLAAKRVKPFYEFYEFEIEKFAEAKNLMYVSEKCPFKHIGWLEKIIRELLEKAEEEAPGFKIALLRSHARRVLAVEGGRAEKPKACASCGLISEGLECSFCRLTRRALGYPLGFQLRRSIVSSAGSIVGADSKQA
jgi:uncharacterized protein (TIGR00269 family)